MNRKGFAITMSLLLLTCSLVTADTHYVSLSGSHSSPYTSWATAATNISDAVTVSSAGDTISVTNGVYMSTGEIVLNKAAALTSVNGPDVTVINGNYPNTTNRCVSVYTNAMLCGFTITNGYLQYDGGGVVIYGGIVSNCVVVGNSSGDDGGGVSLYKGGTLANSVVAGNTSADLSGGVDCYYGGIVVSCVVSGNVGKSGGGMSCFRGGCISNCWIINNMSTNNIGGVYFYNGGEMRDCVIRENSATLSYGGVFIHITGTVERCLIEGNISSHGGGIAHGGGKMANCIVRNNLSYANGGGVIAGSGPVRGCLIMGNTATDDGGGIYGGEGDMASCTIVSNYAYRGGGIYFPGGCGPIRNTIVYGNGAELGDYADLYMPGNYLSTLTNKFFYSCTPYSGFNPNQNNITNNPEFIDYYTGNYRLKYSSPCIDAGTNQDWMTNAVDLDGRDRIVDATVDIGAYETYVVSPTLNTVTGDAGSGITTDFDTEETEVTVTAFAEFLNAQDLAGAITITNGEVVNSTTSDRYCLTIVSDPDSYINFDSEETQGKRFSSVSGVESHAVNMVSWFGAAAYCCWLSDQYGLTEVYNAGDGWSASLENSGYRLPSESQWRKVAAWSGSNYHEYGTSSSTLSDSDANFLNSDDAAETNAVRIMPVGSYTNVSPYSCKDCSGNVWEWCHDFYESDGSDPDVDSHAVRGGSWSNLKTDVTTLSRSGFKPDQCLNSVGFRIVKP